MLGARRRTLGLLAPLSAAAIALVAAGCGSSSHPAATGSVGSTAPAASAPPSTGTPQTPSALMVGQSSLGVIVMDAQGRTLYLFEKDSGATSTCDAACASVWPPATTTDARPTVAAGANQSLLGTSMRADGTRQLTYNGHPLYRFAGDQKPGDTNGEGLNCFGARWDAVSPAGQKIEKGG